MKTFRLFFQAVTLWSVVVSLHGEAPDWVLDCTKIATPESAKKAPAVVLVDDFSTEINAKGGFTEVHRRAVRILHNSGSNAARGVVHYIGGSDKVNYVGAWLVRGEKTVETKKKGDWLDMADNAYGAVIDEQRKVVINLSEKAVPDDVFGYETRREGTMLVAQLYWGFGEGLPIVSESLNLTLPAGFELEPTVFGPMPLEVVPRRGQTWGWKLGTRAYHPEEPFENPRARTDAELYVRIIPPAGANGFAPRSFRSWTDVVDYYQGLNVGQCDTSAALVAKAQELVAGKTDALAKIRALGGHVQKLRYIAFNQDLRLGYGFKPRKASVVFSTGFGDCKDKANLLVAMLREAGIKAHSVGAYLGRDRKILPEMPTPTQFNHAIVAIEVGDDIQLPAVVTTEKLGRLLFFDATDPYTMVGDLSESLQGGMVHVEVPGSDALTVLPKFSPESDYCFNRTLDLVLAADGTVQVVGKVAATGQSGAWLRRQFEGATMPKELEALVTTQLSEKFRGAAVLTKKSEENPATGECTLSFTCAQPRYVQWLEDRTGVVKLDLFSRKYLPNFAEKDRALPISLPPLAINDEIILAIPAGYVASEYPVGISLESPYGSCRIKCAVEEGRLVFKRQVVLKEADIPVADYEKLKRFLSDIAKADRTSVLLKRQG